MKKYTLLFIIALSAFAACKKTDPAKAKPEIAFAGLSHNTVVNGNIKDTLLINLRYTIAASAVGVDTNAPTIYYRDSRDQAVNMQPFPNEVADNLPEVDKNISGSITLRLNAASFFVLRPDRPNGDTVTYEIYLKGKNGVESNRITTPEIYIVP